MTTVRDILKRADIHPTPNKAKKKPPIPWSTFVHAHMESRVATDFFAKLIYMLRGVFDAHILVFIHLGSRKVYCSAAVYQPDSEWVMQQARNATMWLEDLGVEPRFLIHDRDTKLTQQFQAFCKEADVRSPPGSVPKRRTQRRHRLRIVAGRANSAHRRSGVWNRRRGLVDWRKWEGEPMATRTART